MRLTKSSTLPFAPQPKQWKPFLLAVIFNDGLVSL